MFNDLAYNRPSRSQNERYGSIWSDRLSMVKPILGQSPIKRGKLRASHLWILMNVPKKSGAIWVRVPKANMRKPSCWAFTSVPAGQPKSYTIY